MPDINIGDAVPFDQLHSADLVLGCVYRGGTAGSVADDPLNRLIPVGNAGGFRYKGSSEAPLLIALYTTGAEDDWPDSLDPLTSTFTYYGDNRKPGRDLLDTPRHGNEILRRTFERVHGDPRARAQVAPHLLFAKAGQGRDVVFRGLLAPGAQTLTASEDLVVIAHDRQGLELRNYRAKFTVLDARHVTRAWLNDVLAGEPFSGNCPEAWREWVTRLAYQPLARFPQDAEERAACQRSLGNLVGRVCFLRAGGHQFSRLVAACSPGGAGLGGQRDHPLAGEGLGEPVRVALGEDQVGVVQQPVHGRRCEGLGHDRVEARRVDVAGHRD